MNLEQKVMADTYNRATRQQAMTNEMKAFAKNFYQKFRESQQEEK